MTNVNLCDVETDLTTALRSSSTNCSTPQVVSREPGCRVTWEGVVSGLGGVVASSSRPWGQHVGALIGLLTLGCPALLHSLTPIARSYHNRLAHAIAQAPSPTTRDALDAHTAKCLLLVGIGIILMLHCPTKGTEH